MGKNNQIDRSVKQSIRSLKFKLMKDNNWTNAYYEDAESEYIRFLKLRMIYPHVALAPSELIDTMWHAHILNTEAYHRDCNTMFGKYLHHVPHLEEKFSQENESLFENTKNLFSFIFKKQMIVSAAARCQGKPCHVPSNCRCR